MKSARIGIAVTATAFTLLASATAANAATGQVTQVIKFHGPAATATWISHTASGSTATVVNVTQSALFVLQITLNVDSNGNLTGGTQTSADVTSGFSFAIDQAHLTTGSTNGSGIPATTCTFDANGLDINCTPTTIDLTVTWTGQGPITHAVSTQHFKTAGFSEEQHTVATARTATPTGTLSGSMLGDMAVGELFFATTGTTELCIGNSC
jgi:hypothetical protein